MQVAEIMSREVVTVTGATVISRAERLLAKHAIRHLPVVEGGRLVGVVSDRDLLESGRWLVARVDEEDVEMEPALVREVMHAQPVTVGPDDDLADAAAQLVEWGIGCAPVLRGRELVGMLTESDVLRAFADACRRPEAAVDLDLPVSTVMTRRVATATPDTSRHEAEAILRSADFRHLPIVEGGHLVGILSDRDLRRAAGAGAPDDLPVREIMRTEVVTCLLEARLSSVARTLLARRIGCVPVVDDGRLHGLITSTDVLAHCATVLRGHRVEPPAL